jgi:CIC family chloride channel protein
MSLPGGVIGPSLFIGAMLGGLIGSIGEILFPNYASSYAFYAMIGMAAMMSATLQAPLAALITLLEFTNNANILLPGMMVLVISNLVVSQLFKLPSIFQAQMQAKGLEMTVNPLSQFLRSVGVAGVMERKMAILDQVISYKQAENALENSPRWILIKSESVPVSLMPANDLARYLLQQKEELNDKDESSNNQESFCPIDIDLLKIPADRKDIGSVYLQATLEEALDTMDRDAVNAVYIYRTTATTDDKIYGVVTRKNIESHYSYKK